LKDRRAEPNDLDELVEFTAAEAREAEGCTKDTKTLVNGIKAVLEDRSIAMYWLLKKQYNQPVGRTRFYPLYPSYSSRLAGQSNPL